MGKLLKPTWLINHYKYIDPAQLKKHGYSGVILDLDNTILPWNQEYPTDELADWIEMHKKAGTKIYLLSNNKQKRVAKVAESLDIDYQSFALKPSRRSFKKALDVLGLAKDEVLVIGDQIITDVLGANRLGIDCVLVKPLVKSDTPYTWVNRLIEKLLHNGLDINLKKDWGTTLE